MSVCLLAIIKDEYIISKQNKICKNIILAFGLSGSALKYILLSLMPSFRRTPDVQ